jgi:prepilin-type processing-associated H-X9-DG protein
MKQFALSILMYAGDNDEALMPATVDSWCIGPATHAANPAIPERGPHIFLKGYGASQGMYACPDDSGIGTLAKDQPGYDKTGLAGYAVTNMAGMKYSDAYGHSYKFTKENYSITGCQGTTAPVNCYGGIQLKAGDFVSALGSPTGTDSAGNPTFNVSATGQMPPSVMTLSYYALPSQTKWMRDQNCPWDAAGGKTLDAGQSVWHSGGGNWGFADGHVKFLSSTDSSGDSNPYQLNRFCDGPTGGPPAGTSAPCNSAGVVRVSP